MSLQEQRIDANGFPTLRPTEVVIFSLVSCSYRNSVETSVVSQELRPTDALQLVLIHWDFTGNYVSLYLAFRLAKS
jgi:hypothetical protein